MKVNGTHFRTVWFEKGKLHLIEQRRLPYAFEIVQPHTWQDTAEAIRNMTVRGAGAIGATGGFGMAQAFLSAPEKTFLSSLKEAAAGLRATRPTAQNLFYGISRVLTAGLASIGLTEDSLREHLGGLTEVEVKLARDAALAEAQSVADEDAHACARIGEAGEPLIPENGRVSTHCNAGWLAFVDWGSAISPVYQAVRAGKQVKVWVDETRPRGQGARLTAWELMQEGIPFELLTDGMCASLMLRGLVDLVIVGSDRIASNGDVANKIGTYPLALAAHAAGVPFYVAAPSSTIDPHCPSGIHIPIEHRDPDEVLWIEGLDREGKLTQVQVSPRGTLAHNPAFDVTPAKYIQGIITEFGIVPASTSGIETVLSRKAP